MIEILPGFPDNVVAFAGKGRVGRDDYLSVVAPAVDAGLKKHEKLRVFYRLGPAFEGVDPMAVWEDFRLGMGHLMRWERVAVITDLSWIGNAMTMFGFMMPGELRVFPLAEEDAARDWITA